MSAVEQQIAKLNAALDELLSQRALFSSEAHSLLVQAVQDQLRTLEATQQSNTPQETSDENRLVTIMFVDVVNSTHLAQQMLAEDWKTLVGDVHAHLSEIVMRWDGEVGQYLGDGMLCFFGTQRSQEDDAVRAVYSALVIQEAIENYTSELITRYKIDFAVRVGISTGRVIVGLIGSKEKRELLALGTPTNLAARLQSLAQPGQIVIDAETYRRAEQHFSVQHNTPKMIRGFDAPIDFYTVKGRLNHGPSQLANATLSGIEIPFIGRVRQLNAILQAMQTAKDSHRATPITVYGDIGIGKSRLLQEALVHAQDLDFLQVVIVGNQEKRQSPYSLIHDFLLQYCQLSLLESQEGIEAEIEARIAALMPEADTHAIAHVMGFLGGFGFQDSPHVQVLRISTPGHDSSAFALISKWFNKLLTQRGLLLAFDNLQGIDQESIDLLNHLTYELAEQPLVILATARSEFQESNPAYMHNHPHHQVIELEGLSEQDTTRLIQTVLEQIDEVPEGLSTLLEERAAGNPLFIEETLRMLFDNGVFEPGEDQRLRVNQFQYRLLASRLPNGLLALFQARLDELTMSARRIVQVAAVIGQTFWDSAVLRLVGLEDVQADLDALEGRGIIVQQEKSYFSGERQYSFRYSLYREVAYDMLTRQRREAYHREFAAWLAEKVTTNPEYLSLLAEHYVKGIQPEKALTTILQSAQNYFERNLLNDTNKMIERGWDVAREVPREIALPIVSRLWMLRAKVLDDLNRYEESSAASEAAIRLMEELPPDMMVDERAEAAQMLGTAFISLGRYEESLKNLTRSRELLRQENTELHAALLRSFGTLSFARGLLDDSLGYYQDSYALAKSSGHQREQTLSYSLIGDIALHRGQLAMALDYFERTLAENRDRGNLYYQLMDLRQIGQVYLSAFAFDLAFDTYEEAEALQERIHYRDPLITAYKGLCTVLVGDYKIGLPLLREGAEHPYQNVNIHRLAQLALIQGMLAVGDYEQTAYHAQKLIGESRSGDVLNHGRALLYLGMAQHRLGQSDAQALIKDGLKNELEYGGRDLWIAYHALSITEPDTVQRGKYQAQTVQVLEALAESLHHYPVLRDCILNSPILTDLHHR